MRAPVVAVVALPRLASEVVGVREGVRVVVVDEGTSPGRFVVRAVMPLMDASDGARVLGVAPGMRILDAQVHAPSLAIDVVTRARIDNELLLVAEALLACAPIVQPLPASCGLPLAAIALDLTGLRAIERVIVEVQRTCARLGHRALVAASPGTRLSLALAHALALARPAAEGVLWSGTLVVKHADIERVLARLPLDALGLSRELAASLAALGARTAADVRALLPKGGVERLGVEVRALLDVVTARYAPLRPLVPPERLIEELELEHPLSELEPLVFVLSALCNRMCMRAHGRGQRLAEVQLTLEGRGRDRVVLTLAFPAALLEDKVLLRSLHMRLEQTSLGGPIDKVVLEATRLSRSAARQLPLQAGAAAAVRAEDALTGLLAEMAAELGAERVGCLVVTNDPLPERMTRLQWPVPAPPERVPAHPRRRSRPPLQEGELTSGGRFLAGWPWPLRLLQQPERLQHELAVTGRASLGILEGFDREDRPYARVYQQLSFADGRRALGLWDEELQETWLHGWFD